MTLTIGSMFSGVAGLDLATEHVFGAAPAWFAEFGDAPSWVLAHHYPDTPNLRDVTTVDWATVDPVDIITGGFPCQDVSLVGKRRGMAEGTRSGLWAVMRDVIAIQQPTWVIVENVRGLLSARAHSDMEQTAGHMGDAPHMRGLGRVLGDLADLGFDAEWRGVEADHVGAPHRRLRIFVLAHRRGAPAAPNPIGATIRELTSRAPAEETRAEDRDRSLHHCGARAATDWGPYALAVRRWERITGRPAPHPTVPVGRDGRGRLNPELAEWMQGYPHGWATGLAEWGGMTAPAARAAAIKAFGNAVGPFQAVVALHDMLTTFQKEAA